MATLKDIARVCNVSVTTVSRALAGYSDVSSATRERVKKAAERLNYAPNILAQNLVRGETSFVGVYMDDQGVSLRQQPFFLPVICGIRDEAATLGLHIVLLAKPSPDASLVSVARQAGIQRMIVMGFVEDDPDLFELAQADVPCVTIDLEPIGPLMGMVTSDNANQAKLVTSHLIEQGYRRILFVGGKTNTYVHRSRERGYREALLEHGIPESEARVVLGHFRMEDAYEAVSKAWKEEPFDAVFAASDLMAEGALRAIKEAGLSVPGDVGVAGFDDLDFARLAQPPLTTVRQDPHSMGRAAVNLLRTLSSEGSAADRQVEIAGELIVRESTRRVYLSR